MAAISPTVVPFPISNEQFLTAVFGIRWGEALVASFSGDPEKSPDWRVWLAADVLRVMTPAMNNYWDVSLPVLGGSRQGQDFGALYAIVLDDYEVKVVADRARAILGEPSYIIETSSKNFQAGWFIEPLTDHAWVLGMLRALYEALGRTGDNLVKSTTLVRLPVGTNRKAKNGATGFPVKLVFWKPDNRIKHLDWPAIEARLGQINPHDPRVSLLTGMPDPAEIERDLILKVFRDHGMILDHGRSMPFGWGFEVECPWAGDHTDPRSAASYIPVRQRFRCHHGHCEDRGMADVRAWADEVIREDSGGLLCLASLEFDDIDPLIGPGEGPPGSRALLSYEATEDGLALAFAAEHEGRLRFDGKRKKWFVWTGAYWRQDDTERAFVWARALLRQYRKGMQDLTAGQAKVWGKIAAARAIEQAARAQLAVDGDIWDRDIWLAGCPGGAIDLRTGAMVPPDPAQGITRQLAVAPDFEMPTPLWDRFLWETTGGDTETITFLQAWYGYNLTGDVSEEKFVFEYGTGGNGKGTVNFTVAAILNDYARRCDVDMFMVRKYKPHSEEVARLHGVRMVTTTESEEGRTFDVVRLKDFTGRDGKLTGRLMRADSIDFTAQFKLTFIGNNQPRLPEVDEAMRRRLILIPFAHTPTTPDVTLKDRLVDEYPGILAWLIAGETLRRASGGLSRLVPEKAKTATRGYLADQDTLHRWGEEWCGFDPREQMSVTEGFEAYRNWCYANNEPIQAGTRTFSGKFTAKFFQCKVKSLETGNVITGVFLVKAGDPGDIAILP